MPEQNPKHKWYHDVWFVILILFVFGPFGFPLLWKSDRFNYRMKWLITILVVLITIVAAWGSVEIIKYAWQQFKAIEASLAY